MYINTENVTWCSTGRGLLMRKISGVRKQQKHPVYVPGNNNRNTLYVHQEPWTEHTFILQTHSVFIQIATLSTVTVLISMHEVSSPNHLTAALTFWRRNYFFLSLARLYINVNNTGTKYVRIMKRTALWRGKNGEYIPRLKYSISIFVE